MRIIILLLICSASYAQDYTLPLSKARLLFHDAVRSYVQDTIITNLTYKVQTVTDALERSQIRCNEVTAGFQTALHSKDSTIADKDRIIVVTREERDTAERKGKLWSTLGKILIGAVIIETVLLISGSN